MDSLYNNDQSAHQMKRQCEVNGGDNTHTATAAHSRLPELHSITIADGVDPRGKRPNPSDTSRDMYGSSRGDTYSDRGSDSEDDEDEDEDGYAAQDEAHYQPVGIHLVWQWGSVPQKHIDFRGLPGVKIDLPRDPKYLDIFKHFFTQNLMDIIVNHTNRYANLTLAVKAEHMKAHPKSRLCSWTTFTSEELLSYIGVTIAMALTKKHNTADYWSTHEVLYTPYFGSQMTRARYYAITKMLHFNEDLYMVSRMDPNYDPLYKIRPVVDILNKNFSAIYTPTQDVMIEDSFMPFKGRSEVKTFDSSGASRHGIKVYTINESSSNYCSAFDIHSPQAPSTAKGFYMAMNMLNNAQLLHKGYRVYAERDISTPELAKGLLARDTYFIGPVKQGQKSMPAGFQQVDPNTPPGNLSVYHDTEYPVNLLHWSRQHDLFMISTADRPTMQVVQSAKGKTHTKPSSLNLHHSNKLKVPTEHMCNAFMLERNGMKWYKKLFWRLMNLVLCNAHIVHRRVTGKVVTPAMFCRDLCVQIALEKRTPPPSQENRHVDIIVRRLQAGNHYPEPLPPSKKRTNPCKQCIVCHTVRRRETRYRCEDCKMALCLQPCFKIFHTELDYKEAASKVIEVKKAGKSGSAATATSTDGSSSTAAAASKTDSPREKRQKKQNEETDPKETAQNTRSASKAKKNAKVTRSKKAKTPPQIPTPDLYYEQAARSTIEAQKNVEEEPKDQPEFPSEADFEEATKATMENQKKSLETESQQEGPQFPSPVMFYEQAGQSSAPAPPAPAAPATDPQNNPAAAAATVTQLQQRDRPQFPSAELYYEQAARAAAAAQQAQKNAAVNTTVSQQAPLPPPMPPRPQFHPELYYEHARSAFEAQKNAKAQTQEGQFTLPSFGLNF